MSPADYSGLIIKSKEFLSVCLLLLNHNEYGQSISRIYYSYFDIARLIAVNKSWKTNYSNHEKVWEQTSPEIQSYGRKLKSFRVKYDYAPVVKTKEGLKDLKFILDNRNKFDALINELATTSKDYPFLHEDDDEITKQLQELEYVHTELMDAIKDKTKSIKN